MPTFNDQLVPLEKLLLDPNNFRFCNDPDFREVGEKRFAEEGVQSTAYSKLRDEGLTDLKRSILANGFLPVEWIIVKSYPYKNDLFVVLEGNRRVAALKWGVN